MATGARYKVGFRRRRELKTDYSRRFALLRSDKPRMVVRKTLNSLIAQIVEFDSKGDRTIASANAAELKKHGWTTTTGNIPAAYLTGYLLAKRAKGREVILDLGRQHPSHGGRLFAAVKGAVDGGLKINVDAKTFPSPERLSGAHIKTEKLKEEFERVRANLK